MTNIREYAIAAARAADDKKADDVRIMDMSGTLAVTDMFVVASGRSDRQVKRIRDALEEALRALGLKPYRREGERYGRWVLLDYLDFVVHVFLEEERSYYDLENLWKVPLVEWRESGTS